jgi:class 3 adenylate cyclase
VDWDETGLVEGAPDPDVRRALLDDLAARGFDLDLMRDAHSQGRLYSLAGDQQIRPGRRTLTLPALAEVLQQDVEWTRRMWRALGLTDPGPDQPVVSQDEAARLGIWAALRELFGDEQALALARVHGAAFARVSEAVSAAMSIALPDIDMVHGQDELSTARAFAQVSALMPQVSRAIDLLYRMHLGEATRYLESAHAPGGFGQGGVRYCIGFADLCGFTAATERLSTGELTALLAVFECAAHEEALAAGGRCVKLIGDAAMIVAPSADALAEIAHRVLTRMGEAHDALPVRVGMAAGDVLLRDGDYFGPPVNLAARMLGLADAGFVLADAHLAERLDRSRWQVTAGEPREVKGLQATVVPYEVRRAQ